MAFHYAPYHREQYYTTGLTVLRDLIPVSLLTDLRRETDKAREIARRVHGAQAQRLQPVYQYDELDERPFHDFLQLPGLQQTVRETLGPEHRPSQILGVLLEPARDAWCTDWHRDWRHHVPGLEPGVFDAAIKNLGMFNQLNAALYQDDSLWAVPGSHNRPDTEEELALFPERPARGPVLTAEMNPEEREHTCLTYVRRMPGAIQVTLNAGDVAFYRACLWHIGNYVPYTKRATLHDGFYCPDDLAWQAQMREIRERMDKAGATA